MATNKNITMKQYNGTDYDVLYPKTKVSQVDGAVASVNNVTPDNTGAVKVDTFEQSIKIGKNVDVGTDGGASAVQFHFDGNANAYTSRIVERESGALTVEAILKLIQALGIEFGGTNAKTAEEACSNLGAVKKSGDTMTGNLVNTSMITIRRDNYPSLYYENAAKKNKAALICAASSANADGGIGLRAFSSDSSSYKDIWYTYSLGLELPNTVYGTSLPSAGHVGRIFFKKV